MTKAWKRHVFFSRVYSLEVRSTTFGGAFFTGVLGSFTLCTWLLYPEYLATFVLCIWLLSPLRLATFFLCT